MAEQNTMTNEQLRNHFEQMVMDKKVPYINNFINEHNFAINPHTDNYVDMGNEVAAFNIFKEGFFEWSKRIMIDRNPTIYLGNGAALKTIGVCTPWSSI